MTKLSRLFAALPLIFLIHGPAAVGASDAPAPEAPHLKAAEYPLTLPDGWYLGEVAGLEFTSKGHMVVFNRGQHPLMEFDANGKFLREIGLGLFKVPHGLRVDAHDNIWTTDQETHQVLRFDTGGKVTLILGRRDFPGTGWYDRGYSLTLLNQPSDVSWDSKGNIYVADAGNFRIVKFSPHGELITSWGQKGDKPGEFNFPHSIVVDAKDRLYITDRENARVQIFGTDGKFIKEWDGIGNPYIIQMSDSGTFWITDARAGKVIELDGEGRIVGSFGEWGKEIGDFGFPHGFDIAKGGAVYVGELLNWRVQKLTPSQR